ncbi:hypothetical protein RJT34_11028 [Clitoria ternatea]|uniref:Uncharacterized protein n=1 Tax=Clitoria ternatea TaxID=43366 RepID=A0AAN9JL55_CLITE
MYYYLNDTHIALVFHCNHLLCKVLIVLDLVTANKRPNPHLENLLDYLHICNPSLREGDTQGNQEEH